MNDYKNKISKIQEQFWVLNSINPGNTAYHITSLFRINGKLNIIALNNAINLIISRHEILRTYFDDSSLNQITVSDLRINIQTETIFEKLDEKIKKRFKLYILSSSIDNDDKLRALENKNVVDYIEKPLTEEKVFSML